MSNRTSAVRYARALLEVARREGDPQAVERAFGEFVSMVQGHAQLARVVVDPAVPAPRKVALVRELAGRLPAGPILEKLLVLLAGRDRLVLLPDILAEYRRRLLEATGVVQAQITTAVPLPPDRAEALRQALAARTGREVVMGTGVDPSIIGGVVARIGSVVYDGSVKRQLEKMKEALTSA